MAKPQFNPLDRPVHNSFDLPAICDDGSPPTKPCCGPCTDWLFCLKRSPIELNLPGFDFSAWLPGVSMCSTKILPSSGVAAAEFSNSDGSNEFAGRFIALPDSRYLTQGDCGTRTERCNNPDFGMSSSNWGGNGLFGWFGWWWGWWWGWLDDTTYPYTYDPWFDYYLDGFYGRHWEATHHTMQPRTVYAPAADFGQVKNFYIDTQVRCVLDDDDQPCLEFLVLLRFAWEKAVAGCVGCTFDEYGINACSPSILGAVEAAEGWNSGVEEYQYCVPLLRSDLIPLAGLAMADLVDVPLSVVPPPEWTLVSPGSGRPDYWALSGGSVGGAVFPELGLYKSIGWMTGYDVSIGCVSGGSENTDCGGTEAGAPARGRHPTGHTCPTDVWLPVGCGYLSNTYFGYGVLCVPAPISVNGPNPKLSVLSASCFPPQGCASCIPDPEKPHIAKRVEFSVVVTGSGCNKTFTPVITDCVNVVKVYYSWGVVGDGLDPVTHEIINVDSDGVSRSETFTAIAVDDRGCFYCFTDTVICGCCPGTSGSLTATSTGLNFFDLCATTNGTPESGPCAGQETVIVWTGTGVTPNSGALGNGDCQSIEVTGANPSITYRVMDGQGCLSDPVTLPLWRVTCACCTKPINGVRVTIGGWIAFDPLICARCDEFNQTYEMHPDGGVDFTCLWRYQTALGHGPEIVCRDPSEAEPLGYIVGREIFFTIECHDDILRLIVYANMSEGTAIYYKDFACPGCDAGLNPADCAAIIGDIVELDLDALGILGTAPVVAGCDPMPSTCVVEIDWGS